MARFVVTGFGRFFETDDNPTQRLVQWLASLPAHDTSEGASKHAGTDSVGNGAAGPCSHAPQQDLPQILHAAVLRVAAEDVRAWFGPGGELRQVLDAAGAATSANTASTAGAAGATVAKAPAAAAAADANTGAAGAAGAMKAAGTDASIARASDTTTIVAAISGPMVLLHLGVNAGGECFELECTAYNNANFRSADEGGGWSRSCGT